MASPTNNKLITRHLLVYSHHYYRIQTLYFITQFKMPYLIESGDKTIITPQPNKETLLNLMKAYLFQFPNIQIFHSTVRKVNYSTALEIIVL